MQMLLKRQEVNNWLESKVTLRYLAKIQEHLIAHKEGLNERVLLASKISDIEDTLNIVKGEIFALELVQDVNNFLIEEIQDEEVPTHQTDSDSEDSEGS